MRWLGETKKGIKKLILVAPALGSEENEFYKKFCEFEIDNTIKKRVDEIIIFVSNNDKPGRLESGKLFSEKLGGRLIELKGRGHFTESGMGSKEFPELFREVLENCRKI